MSIFLTLKKSDQSANGAAVPEEHGLLWRWLRAAVRSWQRRKMIATLSALDDHVLRDIGIDRGDIERVVDHFDDQELAMSPIAPDAEFVEAEHYALRKAA